ncbi:hypothetical protein GCM10020000_30440 [Streptomyces olivoverticillatus]
MRIADEVQELLVKTRRAAGVDTYFSTYRDGEIAVVAGASASHPATGGFSVGRNAIPHATAHGKVLLAGLPRAARLRHLATSGMRAVTARTITSPEQLDEQLRRVRREGVAVEIEECAAGGGLRGRTGARGAGGRTHGRVGGAAARGVPPARAASDPSDPPCRGRSGQVPGQARHHRHY